MKALLIISSLLLLFVNLSLGQSAEANTEKVYNYKELDAPPTFPGCEKKKKSKKRNKCAQKKLNKFISKELKYPIAAEYNSKVGIAVIKFIVEKNGIITNAKISSNPGYGMGEDALRIVNKMPKWTPGTVNNQPVRTYHSIIVQYGESKDLSPIIVNCTSDQL